MEQQAIGRPIYSPQARAFSGLELLFLFVISFAVLILFFANPFEKTLATRALSTVAILVGVFPFLVWLQQPSRDALPLIAFYGASTALCYGLAGFLTPVRYIGSIQASDDGYVAALSITIISLIFTYLGHAFIEKITFSESADAPAGNSVVACSEFGTKVLYFGFPFVVVLRLGSIIGPLDAFHISIEVIANMVFCWLLVDLFRIHYIGQPRRILQLVALPYFFIIAALPLLNGVLFPLAQIGLLVILSYTFARRRFPLVFLLVIFLAAALLQPVKSAFRAQVWAESSGNVSFIERGSIWLQSFDERSRQESSLERLHEAFTRYNHLHLTAAITDDVPNVMPYLLGETYVPLLTKFIPRIIWAEKPLEDSGNSWAKPLGWISSDDFVTSLNLPWIAEMYVNFGWAGIVGVSFVLGLGFGAIRQRYLNNVGFSAERFAVGYAVASPLMLPQESNMSIMVGNMVIAMVTCYLVQRAIHRSSI